MSVSNYMVKNYILDAIDKKFSSGKSFNGSYLEKKMDYTLNNLIYITSQIISNETISFKSWKEQIENEIMCKLNVSLDDLPDENYHINYENGMSVDEMINIIIENNRVSFF